MATRKTRSTKGAFGENRLPLAGRAMVPESRRRPLWGGILAGGAVLALLALGAVLTSGRGLAPGPVASAHAGFEESCESCHRPLSGVSEEGCLLCHDRRGLAAGTFGFESHFAAFPRAEPAGKELARRDRQKPCSSCHREHGGREAPLTEVADSACAACHGFRSFGEHPEFAFARLGLPDSPGLRFLHRRHVRELERSALAHAEADNPQLTCLYCHNPDPEGAGFSPLD
ncbi:MAG: cytochrome c3 family protein, partial [Acidobacteria bacterium]|nr:cytochrome c3 family protein [Acidobacteriota bacterium]